MTNEEKQALIEFLKFLVAGSAGQHKQIYEIALAALTAEPVGSFHISGQQVEATTDYVKDGEWPIDDGELQVFAAQPVHALKLPDELPYPFGNFSIGEVAQWNACIGEVKRLNAAAPAINLAELVPGEVYWKDAPVNGATRAAAYAAGANWMRAAILRKIEEAK